MFEHDTTLENAVRFSRFDENHPLSTVSNHMIRLDGESWKTAEHYFNVQMAAKPEHVDELLAAPTGAEAHRIGNLWYRRKRAGWKKLRRVMMTRALFTKVQMYEEVKTYLLDTEEALIIETSLYDHFWGVGRDQRGENTLGKIWLDIRRKLHEG